MPRGATTADPAPGAHVQQLLKPTGPRACAPQEKTLQREAQVPQLESSPGSA